MFRFTHSIALAAIALTSVGLVASTPAAATPTIDFSIVTNAFSKPTMEFEFQGGKYVWKQQVINTQFTASADTNDNKLVWYGPLHVETLGGVGKASFLGSVPELEKTWNQSGPIAFPVSFLNVYQGGFASYCDSHGGQQTHVSQGLMILFRVYQRYAEINWAGSILPGEVGGTDPHATRNVTMPVTVVCGPKPAKELPRPGGLISEKGDMSVKSIALNYGGFPVKTKPNPATECKQAKLTVTLQASQAGPVKFRLHKKVGNAPIQAKAVDAWAKFDGNAHFVASHHEIVSVTKTDLVQAMAEDLVNPIGLSTGWKDVTLQCSDVGGGGFAGTPGNANPDNGQLPTQPKQPKRVFDGPGSLTPGAKPTHTPLRPVIAPATPKKPTATKTAPVPGERSSLFIGTAVPRAH
jgi:hypothetical protein